MIRDWEPHRLSKRERRILRALAEALYEDPTSTEHDFERARAHVFHELEAWLSASDVSLRAALRGLLLVIELSPLRHGFGLRTMSGLPLPQRARYLADLEADATSSLSTWKTLMGSAYFSHPDVARDTTGHDGARSETRDVAATPPLPKLHRPRRGRTPSDMTRATSVSGAE